MCAVFVRAIILRYYERILTLFFRGFIVYEPVHVVCRRNSHKVFVYVWIIYMSKTFSIWKLLTPLLIFFLNQISFRRGNWLATSDSSAFFTLWFLISIFLACIARVHDLFLRLPVFSLSLNLMP